MIVLHTTHCPKCGVLTSKLNQKNIDFVENENIEIMLSKGIDAVPCLEVDGEIMDFNTAVKWVNER